MAELIRLGENHAFGYVKIIDALLRKGRVQPSRNGNTIEIQDFVIEIRDNSFAAPNGTRPGYQVEIGLVEGLQLIAGLSDSALTAQIQPNFRNFMEDNGKFWGAYGPRTAEQFPIIAERLKADHDTRQAVVTIWNPEFDAQGGKKDHPCTTLFNFLIRDGKLNMTTYMRSCDAWWGWPYDALQFAMVHHTMASVVGVPVGTYTHHANSFHLYEPHWEEARKMVDEYEAWYMDDPSAEYKEEPFVTPVFSGEHYGTWEQAAQSAFNTYRVVTQTLPVTALESDDEKRVAELLMKRRAVTLDAMIGKL